MMKKVDASAQVNMRMLAAKRPADSHFNLLMLQQSMARLKEMLRELSSELWKFRSEASKNSRENHLRLLGHINQGFAELESTLNDDNGLQDDKIYNLEKRVRRLEKLSCRR